LTKAVNINIGKEIKDLDDLKDQNAVFKEISSFSKEAHNNEILREELIKRLGSIWEETEEYEDFNVKKLQLNDELLKEILKQAEQLAVDMILERSEDI
jgi:isocitrate dehydrogenase kinase/phosphatase